MDPIIIIAPLLVAMAIIAAVRKEGVAKYVALGASIVSLLLFCGYFALPSLLGPLTGSTTITWFKVSTFTITLSTYVSQLNEILLGIVLLIGVLIFLYSIGFMDKPSEQRRFHMEMLAFEAAMLLFAMAGDLIVLFIAWEFLSLTSYLLIGFWYNGKPARAARKAITIIVLGDIALLASLIVFFSATGTLSIPALIAAATAGTPAIPLAAMILLVIAIATKSAQFPFQEWLPDAMEGPTPVSAYLHSTTMVKAGVFVAIVLYPLFAATGTLYILLALGLLTAVLSMLNAMREKQVKRVIAYSTVQELSLMLLAVGGGAVAAAIYFFIAQSFYKALLFFGSGVMMKATGEEGIDRISGLGRNKLVLFTTLFGVLALAGFVPFDGFFANIGLGSAFTGNLLVYSVLSLIGLGTSFYIFRWFFTTSKPAKGAKAELGYGAQPKTMLTGMVVLSVLTLLASLLFFTSLIGLSKAPSLYDAVIETALVSVGLALSYLVYKRHAIGAVPRALGAAAYNSTTVNAFYSFATTFAYELSRGVAALDTYLSDAFDSLGYGTTKLAMVLRRVSVGSINPYVVIVAGAMILTLSYLYLMHVMI